MRDAAQVLANLEPAQPVVIVQSFVVKVDFNYQFHVRLTPSKDGQDQPGNKERQEDKRQVSEAGRAVGRVDHAGTRLSLRHLKLSGIAACTSPLR